MLAGKKLAAVCVIEYMSMLEISLSRQLVSDLRGLIVDGRSYVHCGNGRICICIISVCSDRKRCAR